jgi:hypothetical protein
MIDAQTSAAKSFYRAIREFSEEHGKKPWLLCLVYETKPDEAWDITLVSRRVYGRRDEFLAVMAAASLDSVHQPLAQKKLFLPTEDQLMAIKRRTGFESQSDYREDFAPTWVA